MILIVGVEDDLVVRLEGSRQLRPETTEACRVGNNVAVVAPEVVSLKLKSVSAIRHEDSYDIRTLGNR